MILLQLKITLKIFQLVDRRFGFGITAIQRNDSSESTMKLSECHLQFADRSAALFSLLYPAMLVEVEMLDESKLACGLEWLELQ